MTRPCICYFICHCDDDYSFLKQVHINSTLISLNCGSQMFASANNLSEKVSHHRHHIVCEVTTKSMTYDDGNTSWEVSRMESRLHPHRSIPPVGPSSFVIPAEIAEPPRVGWSECVLASRQMASSTLALCSTFRSDREASRRGNAAR